WREARPGLAVVNEYGPTEATVGCVAHELPPGELPAGAVPVGRPIANARAYVLTPQGEMAPPGVEGELWVGGGGRGAGLPRRPRPAVVDEYRPPEATVGCVAPELPPGGLPAGAVPGGRAVANARAYVLAPQGEMGPPGVGGELWVGGGGRGAGLPRPPRPHRR